MMQIFIDVLKIIISITVVDCLLMGILHPYFAKKVSERRHRGLIWLTAVKAAITGGSAMRSFEGSGILPWKMPMYRHTFFRISAADAACKSPYRNASKE